MTCYLDRGSSQDLASMQGMLPAQVKAWGMRARPTIVHQERHATSTVLRDTQQVLMLKSYVPAMADEWDAMQHA